MITITMNIGPVYPRNPIDVHQDLLDGYPFPKGNNLRGYMLFSGDVTLEAGQTITVDEKKLSKGQLADIISGFASGKLIQDSTTLAVVQAQLNKYN
jgi:hypothetical protein